MCPFGFGWNHPVASPVLGAFKPLESTMKHRPAVLITVAAIVISALSVSACANHSQDSAATDTSAAGAIPAQESAPSGAQLDSGAAGDPIVRSGGILGGTRIEQQVISHASLTIRTPDVGQAMIRAEGVATGAGGFVSSENTQADRKGKARTSSLVFRVPSSSFEATLRALRALGDLEAESTSRQDVTADVVDVQSRVASAKATISRIQVLLGRAQDLGDVIKLESELSTRQSDLEALEARLSYLSDQAAMSTISLTIVSPTAAPAPKPDKSGFVGGLHSGWDALVGVLVGIATVAGALLPFLGVVLLVGIPGWFAARGLNRRRRTDAPPPPTPTAAGS
jgi:hypothetical protein